MFDEWVKGERKKYMKKTTKNNSIEDFIIDLKVLFTKLKGQSSKIKMAWK